MQLFEFERFFDLAKNQTESMSRFIDRFATCMSNLNAVGVSLLTGENQKDSSLAALMLIKKSGVDSETRRALIREGGDPLNLEKVSGLLRRMFHDGMTLEGKKNTQGYMGEREDGSEEPPPQDANADSDAFEKAMEAFLTKKGIKLSKKPKRKKKTAKEKEEHAARMAKIVCYDCRQPGHLRGDPRCPEYKGKRTADGALASAKVLPGSDSVALHGAA